jgi:hypothetical protein
VEAPGERSNGFPLSALFIPSCVSAVMLNVCCAGWVFLLWWAFSWLPASTGFDWMIRYSSGSCCPVLPSAAVVVSASLATGRPRFDACSAILRWPYRSNTKCKNTGTSLVLESRAASNAVPQKPQRETSTGLTLRASTQQKQAHFQCGQE